MNTPTITGPMRILRKWARRWHHELPTLQLPPTMTDDDVDFWGDILYFRGLLDDIAGQCTLDTRLAPIPSGMSTALDAALILAAHDFADTIGRDVIRGAA